MASHTPKPRFLSYLENRIRRDLLTIRENDVEGRLQEQFWTITQECDQRILEMQKRERPELEQLKHEILKLKTTVSNQREEKIMMQMEIDKMTSALQEEHERYRHELDAKHLLVNEINAVRVHYDELEDMVREANREETGAGDPTMLRIALEQARKAQSEADFELAKMRAEYVEVVPKKQFETLQKENQTKDEELIQYEGKYTTLTESLKQCEDRLTLVIDQRDEYHSALQQLNRSSTPRPDWNEAGRQLSCGLAKWTEDTRGMASQQKMHHLIDQFKRAQSDKQSDTAMHPAKGNGDDIPRFLRYEGPDIFRRSIQARDCLIIVEAIWAERRIVKEVKLRPSPGGHATHKQAAAHMISFDELLEQFFNKTHGLPQIRLEWAYAFYDTLGRHKDYDSLREMRQIIDNEAISCEDFKTALESTIGAQFENKIQLLVDKAILIGNRAKETQVTPAASRKSSAEKKSATPEETALDQDWISDSEALFQVQPGEDYNEFLRELMRIYEGLKSSFIEEIVTELQRICNIGPEGKGQVTAVQLHHAIDHVFPNTAVTATTSPTTKAQSKVAFPETTSSPDACVEWIMRPKRNEAALESISFELAVKRLAGSNLFPHSISVN